MSYLVLWMNKNKMKAILFFYLVYNMLTWIKRYLKRRADRKREIAKSIAFYREVCEQAMAEMK
jgi:hypothetical protein